MKSTQGKPQANKKPTSASVGANQTDQSGTNAVSDGNTDPPPSVITVHDVSKYCFAEAIQLGKCTRGRENCKHSHDITPEMRRDTVFMEKIIEAKDEKAAKCFNEFKRKGLCKKGKYCRFSHQISEGHRQDPALQKIMDEKHQHLFGSRESNVPAQSNRYSRSTANVTGRHQYSEGHPSLQNFGGYPVKRQSIGNYNCYPQVDHQQQYVQCPASFDIPDNPSDQLMQADTAPQSYTQFQQREQHSSPIHQQQPTSNQGFPLDSAATIQPTNTSHQMQTINLLQSLLSHMMMVTQTNGQGHPQSVYP